MTDTKFLIIGWLYPELMNIYGDRGNITVLQKRCEWRNIKVEVKYLNVGFDDKALSSCDLLLMGGAQDKQQQIVNKDLTEKKPLLLEKIENNIPGLYVCGGYQFLGKYYKEADGNELPGLGIFDLHTEHPGENSERLIGNMILKSEVKELENYPLIGFENHGGRTYLGSKILPFAMVIKGFGNNGIDKTEGARYKNSFGTYSHGPILPKNPLLADFLIQKALEIKYKEKIYLEKLDDSLEEKARMTIAKRLSVAI